MNQESITIYVDGCRKGCGTGGWAYIMKYKDNLIFESGYAFNTTNNMTELFSPIKALQAIQLIKDHGEIKFISDSKYLVDGFNSWMHSWKRKGWVRNHGEKGEVLNLNLWKILYEFSQTMKVKAEWVRGHTGIAGNEFCDALANNSVKKRVFVRGSVKSNTILQQLSKRFLDFETYESTEDPYYLSKNKVISSSKKEWCQDSLF